jgi:phage terminase large subunit-like protein
MGAVQVYDNLDMREAVKRFTPRPWNDPTLPNFIPKYPFPKQAAFLLQNGELMLEDEPDLNDPLQQHDEILYGGAAGGGKSVGLLAAAAQFVDVPGYSALLLRRTFSDLQLNEALMDLAKQWWLPQGIQWSAIDKTFIFPAGAKVAFGYLKNEDDKYRYQGASFQFIGMDELTQFSETQYTYMDSRLRKPPCRRCVILRARRHASIHPHLDDPDCLTCVKFENDPYVLQDTPPDRHHPPLAHVPLRKRAGSNPGGRGHLWVKKRFIDLPRPASRLFIPAKLQDNLGIQRATYMQQLMRMDPITRAQLLEGRWDVRPAGMLLNRDWFKIIPCIPEDIDHWVRYWDFAATEVSDNNPDPDYTSGCLVGYGKNRPRPICFADLQHFRCRPAETEARVLATARRDTKMVDIWLEVEPGASGLQVLSQYQRALIGYSVQGERVTGPQPTRVAPLSTAAEAQLCEVVAAPWNDEFFDECEMYLMGGGHDDIVISAAGGYNKAVEGVGGVTIHYN